MTKKMFGTEADGKPSGDWCTLCYENGAFTMPDMTLDDMLAQCMKRLMKEEKASDDQANVLAHAVIPQLKRWHK